MSETQEAQITDASGVGGRRALWSLAAALAIVGGALFVFDFFSAGSEIARRGLVSHRPPVYGKFIPSFSRVGGIALALAAVSALWAFAVARRERFKPALLLTIAVASLLSFASAVAVVNGDTEAYVDSLQRVKPADYQVDVPTVRALGVRTFIRRFPEIAPTLRAIHSKDHPPGPIVLLSYLKTIFPRHLVPRAIVLALLSSLVLVPTWFIARRVAGERAALFAVLLLAAAPAPAIFAFTSLDAVYATVLASAAALLIWGLAPDGRLMVAFVGGAAAGFASFMTYAIAFILVFAVLYALFTRGIRGSIAPLAVAGLGLLVALLLLRLVLGYDVVASYRVSYSLVANENDRSYIYWIFGNPAVWLTFAGLPIAALSVRELIFERPLYLIALFTPLLVADLTRIFPAETERIGQFAYPFIATAAGSALARWEERSGARRPVIIASLVLFAALQTIALEALYYNYW